ncbi:hypothetical protein OHB25_06455 [Streptomyces mirabilis]|uniref:Uncharacterized protein n=1 Tax=Streptomyces mirabilis TaxID=68239 RepID=A0ABU3V3N7_9ACTN|nr:MULTISPECIES: hypothetical protein [Streptomyces]MCX4615303.1 hypothetical protein [Streptomyces mirabilis]MCX5356633.1 hypothetical protein [Streptomyces mirabilis]MDU9000580.1 hypothetical protein [Streptomyces mirabilis]
MSNVVPAKDAGMLMDCPVATAMSQAWMANSAMRISPSAVAAMGGPPTLASPAHAAGADQARTAGSAFSVISPAQSDSGLPARNGIGSAVSRLGSGAARVPASLVITSIMAM